MAFVRTAPPFRTPRNSRPRIINTSEEDVHGRCPLAGWCWLGLARRAHQTRRNIELPGWAKAPRCGEGLAGQAPKRLAVEIDTVWVMGVPSHCYVSALH